MLMERNNYYGKEAIRLSERAQVCGFSDSIDSTSSHWKTLREFMIKYMALMAEELHAKKNDCNERFLGWAG